MLSPPDDRLEYSFRRLPHRRFRESIYFLTSRLHANQHPLSPAERKLVADTLRFFDGRKYVLFCYAVMDDHWHVLVKPGTDGTLGQILHTWKSCSANPLQCRLTTKWGTGCRRDALASEPSDTRQSWELTQMVCFKPEGIHDNKVL
jgi:hypothetical protein